ncbi:MAG: metallophosphoesterase family protein [Candidatus Omnitrophota bacterium]
MRYAVFSDVHSNLEAFLACLDFLKNAKIDKYLFLGDIVGYGADPKECISLLRALNACCVAGNHDWAVVGLTDIDYFNNDAKRSLLWTRENISEADRLFLLDLELVKETKDYCLVHGTLNHPEEFDYMTDPLQAVKDFYALKTNICFLGHSHRKGIYIEDADKTFYKESLRLVLEEGKRYIVNAGSVGQPRDADPRACFCIYDEEESSLEFQRVSYDVASAQKKIIDAGLPGSLACRLAVGR